MLSYNSRTYAFSFVAALEQYVHDLQQDNLHLKLTGNNLLSLQIQVRSGETDTSLLSFCSCCSPVRSSGADTNYTIYSFFAPGQQPESIYTVIVIYMTADPWLDVRKTCWLSTTSLALVVQTT